MNVYTCTVCDERKDESGFYRNKGRLMAHCKECVKARVKARYRRERVKISKYERERAQRPDRKVMQGEVQKRRRARHPEKYKARQAVDNGVRDGSVIPRPCEVCGSVEVQAHHDDYSKPLEVRWLCFVHHRAHHGQVVTATRGAKTFRAQEAA